MTSIKRSVQWLAVWLCCLGMARSEDFAVKCKVMVGEETFESTTLFRAGHVYDVLGDQGETTVFDPTNARFVVLDPSTKMKTELTLPAIDAFCQRMRVETLSTNDPLAQFLGAPSFETTFDEANGALKMSSPYLTYDVVTAAPHDGEALQRYLQFAQGQTKLNTVVRPGNLPPFARMALNASLEKYGRWPTQVNVARHDPRGLRSSVTLRCEYRWQARLVASDLALIDQADRQLATFASRSLVDYQRRHTTTSASATASKVTR